MFNSKLIVYVDMDDVLCDYTRAYQEALTINPDIKYPQSQYGFFVNLPVIEGAVDAVNTLIQSKNYEVYILTAPSTRNPFSYTEKRVWITLSNKEAISARSFMNTWWGEDVKSPRIYMSIFRLY